MRLLAAALLMVTATAASAQPSGNLIHEMTTIGKQKDNDSQKLQPIGPKKDGALYTVVGGGVNTEGESAGTVTVLDDGGPATRAPVPEKAATKAAAEGPSLWDDFVSNFEEGEAKPAIKPAAPAVQKPVAPAAVAPTPKPVIPVSAPKAETKPAASPKNSNEPESTLWEDMGGFFEGLVSAEEKPPTPTPTN